MTNRIDRNPNTPTIDPARMHRLLDQIKPGDKIIIRRINPHGPIRYAATISGPALVQQPVVGIDLLDGQPHLIRDEARNTSGTISYLRVERGRHEIGKVTTE